MKKTLLRSIFAAIVLCCATWTVTAQEAPETIRLDLVTSADVNKLVLVENVMYYGMPMGDATLAAGVPVECEANGKLNIQVEEGSAAIGATIPWGGSGFSLVGIITAVQWNETYQIAESVTIAPRTAADIILPTSVSLDWDDSGIPTGGITLGETVELDIIVKASNLQGDITFSWTSSDDEDATCTFTPASLSPAEVDQWGAMVTLKVTPSKLSTNSLGHTFNVWYETAGLEKTMVGKDIDIIVNAPKPEFTAAYFLWGFKGDIYVGETYQSVFDFKGNEHIPSTVTIKPAEGSGITAFGQTSFTKAELQGGGVEGISITFTPSTAGEKVVFPFIIEGEGMEPITCEGLVCEVLPATPSVALSKATLSGEVYQNVQYTKTIEVTANPYVADDAEVVFTKVHADIDKIVPEKLTGAEAKAGAEITVYITPKTLASTETEFTFDVATTGFTTTHTVTASKVLAQEPKLTIETEYNVEKARVGKTCTRTFTITGNPYITAPVTFVSKSGDEITNITPSSIPAADLAGKTVTVTVEFTPAAAAPDGKEFIVGITSTELAEQTATFNLTILEPATFTLTPTSENYEQGVVYTTVGKNEAIEFKATGANLTSAVYTEASVTAAPEGTPETSYTISIYDDTYAYLNFNEINSAAGFAFSITFTTEKAGTYTCKLASSPSELDAPVELIFYIVARESDDTNALENATVAGQATKIMENGQIFIIRDGVRYNILGTVVK